MSRSAQSSGMSAGASTLAGLPLTVSVYAMTVQRIRESLPLCVHDANRLNGGNLRIGCACRLP